MGHTIGVHRDTYRLADETFEVTQVATIMQAIERGELKKAENNGASLKEFVENYNPIDSSDDESAYGR